MLQGKTGETAISCYSEKQGKTAIICYRENRRKNQHYTTGENSNIMLEGKTAILWYREKQGENGNIILQGKTEEKQQYYARRKNRGKQ